MSKIREHAKGQPCCAEIFPHCNQNPETTVLAHIESPDKGVGIKSRDYFGVFMCSDCHKLYDRAVPTDIPRDEILECVLRGLYRTWKILIEDDIILVPKDGSKAYNKK